MGYMGFKALESKVGSPALAAYIGRKKYGKKKFQRAAAKGQKMGKLMGGFKGKNNGDE